GIQMLSNSGVGDLSNWVIDELLEHHWTFTMFESNLTRFEKLKYIDLYEQRLKNVDKASRFTNKPLIHVNTEVSSGFHSPIIKWYETYELTINNTFVVCSFSAPYKDQLDDVTAWRLKQIPEEKVFCEKFTFDSLNARSEERRVGRVRNATGVQPCALPISTSILRSRAGFTPPSSNGMKPMN